MAKAIAAIAPAAPLPAAASPIAAIPEAAVSRLGITRRRRSVTEAAATVEVSSAAAGSVVNGELSFASITDPHVDRTSLTRGTTTATIPRPQAHHRATNHRREKAAAPGAAEPSPDRLSPV